MSEFRMPSLGADMTEGTLLQWLVHPGDLVHKGDVIAEVDTTKAAIEIECFDDGVIGEFLVPEGTTVPVGAALATIEPVGAAGAGHAGIPIAPDGEPVARTDDAVARADTARELPVVPARAATPERPTLEVHTTPLVRKLAAEADIDLSTLHGSGPNGRIVRADVEHAVEQRHSAPGKEQPRMPASAPRRSRRGRSAADTNGAGARTSASGYARRLARELGIDITAVHGSGAGGAVRAADIRVVASEQAQASKHPDTTIAAGPKTVARESQGMRSPSPAKRAAPQRDLAAMRTMIAAAMTRSKQTVPHYYLSSTVDIDAAQKRLRELNLRLPVADRILLAALLFRAVARAARAVPGLNGHWVENEFRPAAGVHLGVVVSLRGGGIILPTIPDADTLDPPAMMAAIRGLIARSRSARLRSTDTTAATITVTNLGDLGVDSVFGVIPVPQVAIVGFGAVVERPCAIDGLLGVRPQLTATLSADHRASDGAIGARFLNTVSDLLQQPEEL